MKVFLTGGTGFVGTLLSRQLAAAGHVVTILTRRENPPAARKGSIRFITGDPKAGRPLDGGGGAARLGHQSGRLLHFQQVDRGCQEDAV